MSLDFYLEYQLDGNDITVFDRNITHNLGEMADKAGIYYILWRPEEKGWVYAKDIVPTLKQGIKKLKTYPSRYKKFNPENNWGSYEGLLEFSEGVLNACKKYPNAKIIISR